MKLSKHIKHFKNFNVFIYGVNSEMEIIDIDKINEIQGQINIDCDWDLILSMTKLLYHKNDKFKKDFDVFVEETRK
jgi:hypothetical protein